MMASYRRRLRRRINLRRWIAARRWSLLILGLFLTYFLAFGLIVEVLDDSLPPNRDGYRSTSERRFIFVSGTNTTVNFYGYKLFYPFIKPGELAGQWEYMHDLQDYPHGRPLFIHVLTQP